MGIYIKGMEMPKDGDVLMVRKDDDGKTYIKVSHTWGYSAELIELPPHGRLIDADKLTLTDIDIVLCKDYKSLLSLYINKVESAQTIIEAEVSE